MLNKLNQTQHELDKVFFYMSDRENDNLKAHIVGKQLECILGQIESIKHTLLSNELEMS